MRHERKRPSFETPRERAAPQDEDSERTTERIFR
jgi:hypothetical protein